MLTRTLLPLVLLPACSLDFAHGASRDPSLNAGHELTSHLVDVLTPTTAASARFVDLDGDGALDLAYLGSDSFVFQLGDGHGNFAAAVPGPAISGATLLAQGDYDGDGRADFVTAAGTEVAVWHGLDAGHFERLGSYNAAAPVVGLALGTFGLGSDVAQVVEGTTAGVEYALISPTDPSAPIAEQGAVVDGTSVGLNIAKTTDDGTVTAFLADHSPTQNTIEATVSEPSAGMSTSSVAIGDLDAHAMVDAVTAADLTGDGTVEEILVCANPAGITTALLSEYNAPGGRAWTSPDAALPPLEMVDVGDLDGDGRADVAAVSRENQQLVVLSGLTGSAAGELVLDATFDLPAAPITFHIDGDVNGDGIVDPIITLSDRIVILMSEAP